ncbi:MAG: FtsX-like permease family protein, partial [Lacunisphaera sp.]
RAKLDAPAEKLVAGLGGEQSHEISFNSMMVIPGTGRTRLVQVRALDGGFPFYGNFVTEPAGARAAIAGGRSAVLEEGVMVQFGLQPGDKVKLGSTEFTLAAGLKEVPGESAAVATFAPRIFIPLEAAASTGLLKMGSLARYRIYFKFSRSVDVEKLVADMRDRFRELHLGFDTVEERKRDLGQSIRNVNSFLSLVGFASLFLGAIGVASAIQAHIRLKTPTVAMLRCLGASARTSFSIYLVQGIGLGVIGATAGALLGMAVELALPGLLKDFLPFAFEFSVSWAALGRGLGAGVVITVLFSLLPLLEIRRVSPLLTLRSAFSGDAGKKRDWMQYVLFGVIVGVIFAFAIWQTGRIRWGVGFGVALLTVFGALAALAKIISWLAKKFSLHSLPFVWRQGIANLYRPNNRTLLLLVSLGMGTFLMMTLYLSRDTLLGQLQVVGGNDRPNLMLFDIQDDQVAPLTKLLADSGTPVRQQAAIVTMRIASIKGRDVAELLKGGNSHVPAWTLRREYRSTFRGELSDTEVVTAGEFQGHAEVGAAWVPISLEEGLARDLHVKLGDEIVFDVQGVPVNTRVGSLRRVDWRRMQPNFFVVFPEGVLEDAPKFHVMALRVASPEQSAQIQQAVVREEPNVSAIDLGAVMQALDSVYSKASFVVEFLALFTVVTGVIVLAGAVLIGRQQRVRESVLLRTLGATKAQVNR